MNKHLIHYIPHTHWDKEWYKTYEEFRVKFVKYFKQILDTLENDDKFDNFMFDGQTSIIEDYLQLFPNEKERIVKLIKNKRLTVGPWFTLPDNYLTNGESLVRNLLIGSNIAKSFGNNQNICYIPDSFGQSDQMPQIVLDGQFDGTILWRGVDSTMTNDAAFNWKGSDGSQILAIHLPLGYGYCKKLPKQDSVGYLEDILNRLKNKYTTNHTLFMGGSDHEPIQVELPQLLEEINQYYKDNKIDKEIVISTLEEFFKSYEKEIDKEKLTTLYGELRSSRDQRLHFGDSSSRMDIKQLNRNTEYKLSRIVEPILLINNIKFNNPFINELINYCWKLIFENQAHDSICTTCVDQTHEEIVIRFKKVNQILDELINYANKNIIEHLNILDKQYFVIYNTNIYNHKGFSEITIDSEYKNFKIFDYLNNEIDYILIEQSQVDKVHTNVDYCNYLSMVDAAQDFKNQNKGSEFKNISKICYRSKIIIKNEIISEMSFKLIYLEDSKEDNEFNLNNFKFPINNYICSINKNGTLKYVDKTTKVVYDNICYFESRGEAGDSYDYSPPKQDTIFNTLNEKPFIKAIVNNKHYKKILVEFNWKLPEKLINEDNNRSNKLVNNNIKLFYTFYSYKNNIDIEIEFDNKSQDHFVSLNFNLDQITKTNVAGQQFGSIKRNNFIEHEPNWKDKYRSKHYGLYPFERYVSLFSKDKGIMLHTLDSSEYKISNDKELRLTLFRSFGFMGKANLEFRPGRPSGIYWKTPNSFLLNKLNYKIQLTLFNGEKEFNNTLTQASSYLNKLNVYEVIKDIFYTQKEIKQYDDSFVLKTNNPNLSLSTYKMSEQKDGYILRVYNQQTTSIKDVKIFLNKNYKIYKSNFYELEKEFISNDNVIEINEIKPNKFLTFKLK